MKKNMMNPFCYGVQDEPRICILKEQSYKKIHALVSKLKLDLVPETVLAMDWRQHFSSPT